MSDIQELIEDIFAAGPTGVILRIVIILIIAFVAQWIVAAPFVDRFSP